MTTTSSSARGRNPLGSVNLRPAPTAPMVPVVPVVPTAQAAPVAPAARRVPRARKTFRWSAADSAALGALRVRVVAELGRVVEEHEVLVAAIAVADVQRIVRQLRE